jgi:protein-tyrosine-phosphatase
MKFLWIAPLVWASFAAAQTVKPEPAAQSTIVFVCEHGSAKSVIAAAHFNRLATEKKLPYRAVARGVNPDDKIPPAVSTGLARDGLDVSSWRPESLKSDETRMAAQVVTLATDLPASVPVASSKLLTWNDLPPVRENYDAARTAIVRHVSELIDKLTK